MATVRTLLGYVKGQKGDKGDTGAKGDTGTPGAAATIQVGSTTTIAAGSAASVENVGTQQAAVLNFRIPQGPPGSIGEIYGYQVNAITASQEDYPVPAVGDTVAVITGKQKKATQDAKAAIEKILGDFAMVESTASASKPYEVGEYISLAGELLKVTAAIARGNAIVKGGNVDETNVGAELHSLNTDLGTWIDVPVTLVGGVTGTLIVKKNKMFAYYYINVRVTKNMAAWENFVIGSHEQFDIIGSGAASSIMQGATVLPIYASANRLGAISISNNSSAAQTLTNAQIYTTFVAGLG